jgi:hypothetical protein
MAFPVNAKGYFLTSKVYDGAASFLIKMRELHGKYALIMPTESTAFIVELADGVTQNMLMPLHHASLCLGRDFNDKKELLTKIAYFIDGKYAPELEKEIPAA